MRAAGAFPFADVVERDLMEVLAEGGGVFAGDSSLAKLAGLFLDRAGDRRSDVVTMFSISELACASRSGTVLMSIP